MDSTNTEELKLLINNKLDNLTNLSKAKTSIKDAPQCTYINMKGVRCPIKCLTNRPNPRCYDHINCKEVVQCKYITKDANDCDVQCSNLTRSAKGLCHYHNILTNSKNKSKGYYQAHKEKIKEASKLTRLMNKIDKITYEVDSILSVGDDHHE